MGAAGGFGGLPSALAEVPVTATVLMRAIQGIAEEHGFDPASEEVRMACLEVFAAAGPLAAEDEATRTWGSSRCAWRSRGPGCA